MCIQVGWWVITDSSDRSSPVLRQDITWKPMLILFVTAPLTHWGRVTPIRASNLIVIGSNNGLLPGRRQAIIWTNAGILLIVPLGTNFNEISIEIYTSSFKKMNLKM